MLEHINRTRMDPQGELDVLFTSTNPSLVSSDTEINRALDHFGVDRATLLQQWTSLTAVPPLAWNENLSNSATLHNQAMQTADEQTHQVEGELALGPRTTAAGYIFEEVHENVYAFGENDFHTHAAFVIDWGFSNEDPNNPGGGGFDDGIQDDLGHRTNYLRSTVYEVGIDVLSDTDANTDVGPCW